MYCDRCKAVFDGSECPLCGGKRVREPKDGDECFLVEKEYVWGEMLADMLRQNEIPFYFKTALGAGMAMNVGRYNERYRFFVPYEFLDEARSIVAEAFPESDV